MSKRASLLRIGAAYGAALLAAALWLTVGPSTGRLWLDALVADVVATLVVFAFSRAHRNSSFYDAYWSVAPPLLTAYWWVEGGLGLQDPRPWLVTAAVVLWSLRLTGNWLWSFPGLHHEDWRYPLLRDRAGRWELAADLLAIHVVPTLQVFLGMLPVYVVMTTHGRALHLLDALATAVALGAVALELVADVQLHRFVRRREPGEVMDRGVWGWSRHPNYLGELCFWVALALYGVAASPSDAWWLFAGAAAMLAMLLGASIPMMEQRSLERRPGYQAVIDRVPRFVPRRPLRRTA